MTTTLSIKRNLQLGLDGNEVREMFRVGTDWLAKNEEPVNKLNVFPVPDGDTGTNMLLTMQSVLTEMEKCQNEEVSVITEYMAKGALMGARGNSGVILSQIMKGFAAGLAGEEKLSAVGFTKALDEAAKAAYSALSKPREGTMLTVIKDAAAAAMNNVSEYEDDITGLIEIVVQETRDSVERTPQLLDVLRDAGVVDAGGQGVCVILEGFMHYLKGDEINADEISIPNTVSIHPSSAFAAKMPKVEEAYGYCTEMILKGENLRQEQVRHWIESQGKSAVVVGDEETIKIHVHTFHPGTIIEFALSLGTVHDLKIQNMDDQHEDFLQTTSKKISENEIAVVAVVAGDGLQEVFLSLGISTIIPGGQTMNPSCLDILQAIESLPSEKVIILPNNKNIIPAAHQAAELTDKTVRVLPTRSIPQGLSAMVSFNCEVGLDENIEVMSGFQEQVNTVEITTAIRDAMVNGLEIQQGEFMGIVDGDVLYAEKTIEDAVFHSLDAVDANHAGIITVFYGDRVEGSTANILGDSIINRYPGTDVEIIRGSQPHYSYIISVER
ncbi:MAG TPA: DAK2 domain-containing protein [Dehalococcoidia bacterium]|nr:DAK2 domain-containing protein [Dehalococcoidia bacterium]